jgi:aerobic-type carbon monoxide dehydrogenase small subunit (CoxS/CutS family)
VAIIQRIESTQQKQIDLEVNGKHYSVPVHGRDTLAEVLREKLDLTGTKLGCNRAECGSCTVIVDSKAVYSCSMLAMEAAGKKVFTIEGLSKDGKLDPLQELFIECDALQCGYCIPGFIMSLKALFDKRGEKRSSLTEEDVRESISGNICRCGAYPNIVKAAMEFSHAAGD